MRRLILPVIAVTLAACGGATPGGHAAIPATGAAGYPATRWVPASPTYLLAAPTVGDAQRGFRDLLDGIGTVFGGGHADIGHKLESVLGVDPLRDEATANIGVDQASGIAIFSEGLNPTIAVHLAQPELLQQFFDAQRQRGMSTQSIVVDGAEVVTARISSDLHVSWAIVDGWWLVHFQIAELGDDGVAWLAHARAGRGDWAAAWDAAQQLAAAHGVTPEIAGFGNLAAMVKTVTDRVPAALACAQLVSPVQRVSFAIDGDGHHAGGHVALELGPAAQGVRAAVLAPPAGWTAATANAPLAVQWNLDVAAVTRWLAPCARAIGAGTDLAALSSPGVRAARGVVKAFDPADTEHDAGAVVLDVSDTRMVTEMLDRVPLRKQLEGDRTFGPYAGHSLGIPTFGRIDYVLTDKLAMVAMGDGLLAQIATGATAGAGAAHEPPLIAVDVAPPALPEDAWVSLMDLVVGDVLGAHRAIAGEMMHWRDGHVALTLDGSALVISASGNRR
jgi:hypothetical protein|nr:hypothetical protein [Kofleriaceae bacterium]